MPPLPFPDPPLAAEGLRLRPKRFEDREALVAAVADPEIPRWTSIREGYGLADADAWFEESEQRRLRGEELNLLVTGADDRLLASLGLIREDHPPGVAEIGYWVAAPARGRGVASRAVALLRDWAVRELGLHRVELLIHVENAPSRRTALKAGFRDTGEVREPPRRCGSAGERSHAVYAWERPGD